MGATGLCGCTHPKTELRGIWPFINCLFGTLKFGFEFGFCTFTVKYCTAMLMSVWINQTPSLSHMLLFNQLMWREAPFFASPHLIISWHSYFMKKVTSHTILELNLFNQELMCRVQTLISWLNRVYWFSFWNMQGQNLMYEKYKKVWFTLGDNKSSY